MTPELPFRKVVVAYGYRLGFAWESPAAAPAVASAVLPNWSEAPPAQADAWLGICHREDGIHLYDDGLHWTSVKDAQGLAHRLQQLAQIRLTTGAADVLFIHAGVVSYGPGLVVIPGASKSGKSTLVSELVAAGGAFYSDEYAVVDETGLVHPYPRALWTRVSAKRRLAIPARDLGWTPQLPPAPIARLLLTQFQPWASWSPQPLSPAQAVSEVSSHVVGARARLQRVQDYLHRALHQATCLQGPRGPAQQIIESLSSP